MPTSTPILPEVQRPLHGLTVLDFSQFLAGPVAAMRLADLGADVIKVERPGSGDACRGLVINDQRVGDNSLLFHTFNRNKSSFAADLKSPEDLTNVRRLISQADVMLHNFRPGIMARIGLDYPAVRALNSSLVYAEVSGYGAHGPWRDKPGQDLLVQSLSGLAWLSGNADDGPVPSGFPLVDLSTAGVLVQGILAQLFRRERSGQGGLVEVDMLSVAVDMQLEHFTAHFNGDGQLPARSALANANVYGAAPYGIYAAKDGYLAIAMTPLKQLAELLALPALAQFSQAEAFARRDAIKALLAEHLVSKDVQDWLAVLEPADIWCAPVLDWQGFASSAGFEAVEPLQEVQSENGQRLTTSRCPIRLDGALLNAGRGAPEVGADNDALLARLADRP